MSLPINTTIGDYQLTEYIGAGGMGEVYRAIHSRLKRVCAIKVLTHFLPGSHSAERFLNEARIQAGLQHPNIVTLYELIEHKGRPCIVMEMIPGQTLDQRIQQSVRLSIAEVLSIFKALLEAVQYMHEHGIVHRDIKSNNIKISSTNTLKLLDFGIAKDSVSPNLTVADACIGTPQNLAPEQILGQAVDKRTDIWALGIILYEMCVGRLPFPEASWSELNRKIVNADYIAPEVLKPDLPVEIVSIIRRCLQKRPIQRYQTVNAILKDLEHFSRKSSFQEDNFKHYRIGHCQSVLQKSIEYWQLIVVVCMLFVFTVSVVVWYQDGKWNDERLPEIIEIPLPSHNKWEDDTSDNRQRVRINVIGEPAEVYRDGVMIGKTPTSFLASPGSTSHLKFKRHCYNTLNAEITVQKSQELYTYQLQPIDSSECE